MEINLLNNGTDDLFLVSGETTTGVLDSINYLKEGNITEILYDDLVALRDSSGLTPGRCYRITDYVTTTNATNDFMRSAGHQFDIMVMATNPYTLSSDAKVDYNVNDTYFRSASGTDLSKWSVKYSLVSDLDDATNGKGWIYELTDEKNNTLGYDFKNLQFKVFVASSDCPLYDSGRPNRVFLPYNDQYKTDLYIWCYTFSFKSFFTQIYEIDDTLDSVDVSVSSSTIVRDNYVKYYSVFSLNGSSHVHDNIIDIKGWLLILGRDIFENNITGFYATDSYSNNLILTVSTSISYAYNIIKNSRGYIRQVQNAHITNSEFIKGGNLTKTLIDNSTAINVSNIRYSRLFNVNGLTAQTGENMDIANSGGITVNTSYAKNIKIYNSSNIELESNQTTDSSTFLQNIEIKSIKGTSANPAIISHNTVNDEFITTYQPMNSQIINL